MDALHYLLVLVSLLLILYQLTVPKRIERKNVLPRPPSLPIIGHFFFIKMLLKLPLHEVLNNLCNNYGPLFLLHLGSRRTLVLSARSDIEECFSKNDIIFSNRPLLPSRKVVEYNFTTLGAPYGNHWRSLRRFFAVEVLSPKSLQLSSTIRTEEIRFMTKYLFQTSFQGFVKVELNSFLYMLDFNIIMKMVAGTRCFEENEIDTDRGKGKLDDLKQSFSPVEPLALGDYFPFLRWLTCYGAEKKIQNKFKKRDAFLQAMLDARQNLNKTPSVSGGGSEIDQTIIDVMLKLKEFEPEFYNDDVMKGKYDETSLNYLMAVVAGALGNANGGHTHHGDYNASSYFTAYITSRDLEKSKGRD
ncbi:hypothetical protein Patl1_08829 [Pistacia atlantica]|uniref:Uncharacterized protein n=1 Tax=Pistacia atlantica TaxID=434234 RepID=A0ACC1AHC1_9ROSI|nr:hypothetical protein Patl1_08829 [Pistacia atlantica]